MMTIDTENELDALRQQVAQYQAWFRAIDENSHFDFWFKNAKSEYTYVNPHFAKNMGQNVCDLQNVDPEEIFEGDRLERVKTLDQQVMDDRYLKRVIPCNASGTLQMHEEHRFAVTDKEGQAIGLGCFAFEVTDKSLAEETLHQAEKIANLCSWRWSAETNLLISCSDQMADFLGVSITEAFQAFPKRAQTMVLEEDRDVFKAVEARIQGEAHSSYEIEYRLRRPDGHVLHVRETAEPFSTSENVVEYLGVMQDITRQKFIEAALKKSNETLEMKVQERTAELLTAKDKAEAANVTKSQFLATMSHELRTPMNGVLGMAEVLQETNLDDDQRDILHIIHRSASALVTILNDILDFSKFETGALEICDEPFDLRLAAHEVVSLLTPTADKKNLDIKTNIHPNVPKTLIGDAGRLRQVILNLMGNAIKFTAKGEVALDIDADVTTDSAKISISVRDTGIGIGSDKFDLIFEQFTQAEQSTTREYGGTGLGLSITRKIVEAMPDGKISVTSELGKGSTFIVDLTLGVAQKPNAVLSDDNQEVVLVVTGDKMRAKYLKETLQSWNTRPIIFTQAKKAVQFLRQTKVKNMNIDAVITDHDLGQYTGAQLLEAIRMTDAFTGLKTILLSAKDSYENIETVDGESLKSVIFDRPNETNASNLKSQNMAA